MIKRAAAGRLFNCGKLLRGYEATSYEALREGSLKGCFNSAHRNAVG
jgi:hypothetical protein